VAVGLALVPQLTRHFVADDKAAANATMDEGLGLAMAFTLPAAIALLIMPFFIIDATVTRGAFTSEDARRTAEVLRQFAWGVPAFVLAKVFTPPFFARQDMQRPMRFSIASMLVNTILGAALFFGLPYLNIDGAIGLGFATSLAGWVNVFLLTSTLAREGVYRIGPAAWSRIFRLAGACLLMGAFAGACAFYYPVLKVVLWRKEVAVMVVAFAGFVLFVLSALGLGAVRLREIRGALRRERGAPGVPTGPDL
jgi:putative peptidoglycan lipid II flippase